MTGLVYLLTLNTSTSSRVSSSSIPCSLGNTITFCTVPWSGIEKIEALITHAAQ